jgi:L-threonylcarbamoyladenylate synthase
VKQSAQHAKEQQLARAIQILRAGGVIALPTDTVYGIAASVDHPAAIERIFSIKGRAGTKALPVLIDDPAQLERFSASLSDEARALAQTFWPGALTIVVPAADWVPDAILRGGGTVGLRMPNRADTLAIIAGAGGALAVTSANRSGDRDARSAAEVQRALGARLDLIVDGGPSPGAAPSTVVDASGPRLTVLRVGAIPSARIDAVAGLRH